MKPDFSPIPLAKVHIFLLLAKNYDTKKSKNDVRNKNCIRIPRNPMWTAGD